MLAALLENNNNTRPQAQSWKVKLDRSGPSRPRESDDSPHYVLADIIAATAAFPEIAGEHPVARAVRRHKWVGEALPFVKEAREKREAAAFLAGAQLADRAVREEVAAADRAMREGAAAAEKLSIEQLVQIIDEVRGTAAPSAAPVLLPARRGASGVSIALCLVLGGVLIGALSSARRY
jgi:hypothetical protein